jgi:archaellum component FlaF (FlaF/FlaG flagellin family)
MGFDSIAGTVIMFIVVMMVATVVSAAFKTSIEDNTNSMLEQSKGLSKNIKTNVEIATMNWDNNTNITTVTVMNNGKTTLNVNITDVYVNNYHIPRNDGNRSLYVEPSTDNRNPGLLDPTEIMTVKIYDQKYKKYDDIYITITTQFGTKEEDMFTAQ